MIKTVIIAGLVLLGKVELVPAQEQGTPMSCAIKGKVICVCDAKEADKNSACSKYPCTAKVAVLEVSRCGSSITQALNAGDTVMMHFAYTLHKTKKLFPEMKEQYPGLKKNKIFTANAEQRNLPGGIVQFVVYDYLLN